jgi:uncharacterized protein with FMN-binding domain
MFLLLSRLLIAILLVGTGCTVIGESKLARALSAAVREEKISRKKMESVLKEYEVLREQDDEKAREYATKVIEAIEMGADSSHIDVVRRQVAGSKGATI